MAVGPAVVLLFSLYEGSGSTAGLWAVPLHPVII